MKRFEKVTFPFLVMKDNLAFKSSHAFSRVSAKRKQERKEEVRNIIMSQIPHTENHDQMGKKLLLSSKTEMFSYSKVFDFEE